MLRTFRLVSKRYYWSKKTRVVLTLFGIVLGVTMIMAVSVLNESILSSYRQLLGDLSGRAEYQVSALAAGTLEDGLLNMVREYPGVSAAVPVVRNNTFIRNNKEKESDALVYGIKPNQDRQVREFQLETGRFLDPEEQDGVLLSSTLAQSMGVVPGDKIQLLSGKGFKDFHVVGVLSGNAVGRANRGKMIFMNLEAAQESFNKSGRIDQIDVAVADNANKDEVAQGLSRRLGETATVAPPAGRGQEIDDMLQSLKIMLNFASAISMLVGLFMIYNTVSIGVKERHQEFSILRSLGARQKDIFRWIMGEALVLGLVATILGILAGSIMARSMAQVISGTLLTIFRLDVSQMYINSGRTIMVFSIGVLATLIAASIPARETLAVSPIEAFRPADSSTRKINLPLTLLGALMIPLGMISVAWVLHYGNMGGNYGLYLWLALGGAMIVFFGTVLILPWLVITRAMLLLRWFCQTIFRLPGRLATDNLGRAPKRTAATVAAVILAVTMVVGMGTEFRAFENYVSGWVERVIGWDLLVTPSEFSSLGADVPFSPAFSQELKSVPGVELVSPERFVFNDYAKSKVLLGIFNMDDYPHFANMSVLEGTNPEETIPAMRRGEGVVVSSNFKARYLLGAGDTFEIASPRGILRLPILAVANDYAPDTGIVYLDEQVYLKNWDDRGVDSFAIKLSPGAKIDHVKAEMLNRWQKDQHLYVKSSGELKTVFLKTLKDSFALSNALIVISLVVGTLGIINTLLISIIERRREIGLLRALGATRRQIRRLIWGESMGMGILAAFFGITLGLGLALVLILWQNNMNGIMTKFAVAPDILLSSLVAVVIVAPLAAWWPARQASRVEITEAMRYE
ncbi:MAG: ABC transporter permease [Bacillota bacterium]